MTDLWHFLVINQSLFYPRLLNQQSPYRESWLLLREIEPMTFITSINSNLPLINQSSQLQYFSIMHTTYFTSWLEYLIHPLVSEALQTACKFRWGTTSWQCSALLWLIYGPCLYLCQGLGFPTDQGLKYAAINCAFLLVHQMRRNTSCFLQCCFVVFI